MPLTDFLPEINGFPCLPAGSYNRFPPRAARSILREARLRTLEVLQEGYYGGVDVYNLPHHLRRWTDEVELETCGIEAGKLFLTLDYFNAGLLLPRKIHSLPHRKQAGYQNYFWQRSLNNLHANTSPLLRALAITALLPDEWYPQVVLDRQIEKELRRLNIFQKITVTADLGLPPGGFEWSAQNTRKASTRLITHLTNGRPWPVRLISDTHHLCNNRQAIAYDLKEAPGPVLRFEIYEPDCICQEHAILVNLAGDRPTATELCPPGPPLKLAGLLCERYQQSSPPLEILSPYQRNEPLRKLSWGLRRWLR